MSVRQRKDGYWIVDYRDEFGKGRTRSFGKDQEAKKKAERFDLEVRLKKLKGEPLPFSRGEGVYLDELAQQWIDEKKAQGRKLEWLRDWTNIFNQYFLPQLSNRPAHMLTQADVLAIVNAQYAEAAQATRNRYVGYIKSMLEFGVQHGHLQVNPLTRWKPGKELRRQSMLTMDEFRRIVSVAPPHLAWALEVAWNVPARPGPSDLYALRFEHADFGRGGFRIRHTKVNRQVFVDCGEAFMRAVRSRQALHHSGYVIEYEGKAVKDLGKSLAGTARRLGLGYEPCMYDVRHLWITTMLDQGLEPSVIAHLAGTSVKMIVKNYYEPHAVERARAVELLPGLSLKQSGGIVIPAGSRRKR